MKSAGLFIFYISLWCSNNFAGVYSEHKNALIFDLDDLGNKRLVDNVNMKRDGFVQCYHCATACSHSSNSKEEQLIHDKVSITQYSTFSRKVYDNVSNPEDIKVDICDRPLVPATVWDTKDKAYKIGYEFYHKDEEDLKYCHNYYQFSQVIDGAPSTIQRQSPDPNLIQVLPDEKNTCTKFRIVNGPLMVFSWIPALSIKESNIESEYKRQIHFIEDEIRKEEDNDDETLSTFHCENYFLDNRVLEAPVETTNNENTTLESTPQEAQDDTNPRLVKTQIMPWLMFQTFSGRLATCAFMNFAFIWDSIANGQLKKIDSFLYSIYVMKPTETQITFGVARRLQAVHFNHIENIASSEVAFEKFAIPAVMYRTVKQIERQKPGEIFEMVVVIHNDINFEPDGNNRICSSKEEQLGLDNLRNMNSKTGFSYVCNATPDVLKKLAINQEI